ncbi:MAG: magnesium transporter, partial [Thiovulaceae bacterium]|nr:magnesium transporter [Sulfurimonadaceae bacterium]
TPTELTLAVESLESDDATDLTQDIFDKDEDKFNKVIEALGIEDQEEITKLSSYDDDQAGAFMQTELFDAKLTDTIGAAVNNLRTKKLSGELANIYQVFIVDDSHNLLGAMALEDLIIQDFDVTFDEIIANGDYDTYSVTGIDKIEDVAKTFEQYDLSVMPVIDWQGKLVGRITSDDIYDVIEELATKQVYNLAGVNDDAENEYKITSVVKKRASWLFLNLITAILASLVIGLFDQTLQAYIPLAILMPIVASMGGNAGTQTLTVMVRQMALGDIDSHNAKLALQKEVIVSIANGLIFAFAIGVIAYFWFDTLLLGLVIALSMLINLFTAGFFGATIPLLLKRLDVDPAVGSTVLLTTVTDVIGFLSFLGLAKLIIL